MRLETGTVVYTADIPILLDGEPRIIGLRITHLGVKAPPDGTDWPSETDHPRWELLVWTDYGLRPRIGHELPHGWGTCCPPGGGTGLRHVIRAPTRDEALVRGRRALAAIVGPLVAACAQRQARWEERQRALEAVVPDPEPEPETDD